MSGLEIVPQQKVWIETTKLKAFTFNTTTALFPPLHCQVPVPVRSNKVLKGGVRSTGRISGMQHLVHHTQSQTTYFEVYLEGGMWMIDSFKGVGWARMSTDTRKAQI
jgi:hypothetical protein